MRKKQRKNNEKTMKKAPKNTPKKNKLLNQSELAELIGTRYSTIKYYSEIGLLPFKQTSSRLRRRYEPKEALKRFKEIKKLKEKRLTIKEIIEYFKKK